MVFTTRHFMSCLTLLLVLMLFYSCLASWSAHLEERELVLCFWYICMFILHALLFVFFSWAGGTPLSFHLTCLRVPRWCHLIAAYPYWVLSNCCERIVWFWKHSPLSKNIYMYYISSRFSYIFGVRHRHIFTWDFTTLATVFQSPRGKEY